MRTFVFISNIPDFLLQPIHGDGSSGADGRRRANRDPRYERLRSLLAEHTSGTMLVMHLESKGFGLALYASEEEALSACKATITPTQPGLQYPPLRLRIVEREKPPPPEPVYSPTFVVEGEEVAKSALALSRGLDLAYRGRAVPRWCPSTLACEDCPLGMSCHRIHRAAHQRTLRKRPRVLVEDGVSDSDRARLARLVADGRTVEDYLVPPALRVQPSSVYVPVSVQELNELLRRPQPTTAARAEAAHAGGGESATAGASDEITRVLAARVQAALEGTPEGRQLQAAPFFLRASFPGGAPWDWAMHSPSGLATLRERCPLPVNGAPTPLDRDLLSQRVFYHMNTLNAFTNSLAAVCALRWSERVSQGFAAFREDWIRQAGRHEREDASPAPPPPLYLVLRPWLCLPTVGCEASVFLERGGRVVRGVVQRYGQLRLMAPAAADTEPTGFVVVGAGQDEVAEAALDRELRVRGRRLGEAIAVLQRHLVALGKTKGGGPPHTEGGGEGAAGEDRVVPPGAAWCAQLAIVPAPAGANEQAERVVVLSFKPYQQALEECPMYTHLAAPGGAVQVGAAAVEVSWNTQKHAYVPLFSREALEALRRP